MRIRNLYLTGFSAVAAAALTCSVTVVAPTIAHADDAAPEHMSFVAASGDTIQDVIDTAVAKYGQDAVSAFLSHLSDSAAAGDDVSFPGLADDSTASQSAELQTASDAVGEGVDVPADIGQTEVDPSPDSENAPTAEPPADGSSATGSSTLGTVEKQATIVLASSVQRTAALTSTTAEMRAKVAPFAQNSLPSGWPLSTFPTAGEATSNGATWTQSSFFTDYDCWWFICSPNGSKQLKAVITPQKYSVRIGLTVIGIGKSVNVEDPWVMYRVYQDGHEMAFIEEQQVALNGFYYAISPGKLWNSGSDLQVATKQYAFTRDGVVSTTGKTGRGTCNTVRCHW